MSGNTPQIVNGPRRSTRIPTKKVFTNEWITEEFVIIESQTTSNGCTTPTKEEFVSTAMNKTTDVLTKYVSDSSDNSSNKTRTVRNRRSKIRPSQKMKTAHSARPKARKQSVEDDDSNQFLTATKNQVDPIEMWEVLVDSHVDLYDMRTACLKNAVNDLLKSMPAWTSVTYSNKWIICEITLTDDGPIIKKSIVFNKDFHVTISIPSNEFVCESDRPVRTADELLNLIRELESL